MKKNIIIAAVAAASALLLSVSCQKENQPESQNGINGGAKTFTATIEQSLTKTTLTNEYKVNWTTGDIININGVTFKATADGTDATKASFAKDPSTQEDPTGETFNAIYPSTLYVTDHFELPATQTYTADQFNAPMYAESTTQSLPFKNICAVLAIKVTSANITTLKSIKVKADKKLNGTFTVASTTEGYKAEIGSDGTDEVVLSVGETAISLTPEGTTFYIAIPEQEYLYLKIYLSEDGTLYKRAMITKKAAGLGTISCNKIYNIDYETNAVQIYADGPYWATMNIGATAETGTDSYGTYFAWGDTEGEDASTKTGTSPIENAFTDGFSLVKCPYQTQNATHYSSAKFTKYLGSTTSTYRDDTATDENAQKNVLDSTDDAATVNWGAAWRMPTGKDGEFKYLIDNTGNEWVGTGEKGKKFTGKGDYSDITLFFPAAGNGDGTSLKNAGSAGCYWSSTLNSNNPYKAYNYNNVESSTQLDSSQRYLGFSVRPVSD